MSNRIILRHGASAPDQSGEKTVSDSVLLKYELGYCDNGIIYSKNKNGELTIVAQELKYGKALPVNGEQGQIFYLLED